MGLKERLKRDEEKADSILSASGTVASSAVASGVAESVTSLVTEPASSVASIVGHSIPGSTVSVVGVSTPSITQSVVVDTATLQAEVSRLTAIINDENSNTFKSRYLTLQGLYKKQGEDITALTQKVDAITKEPVKPVVPFDNKALTKLKEDYGEEIVDVINHFVTEGIKAGIDKELKTVGERIDKVETTAVDTAGNTFLSDLSRDVPDWKQINGWQADGIIRDPRWEVFLNQPAPGTGYTYDQLLVGHYQNRNLSQVKQIFELFKKSHEVVAQPGPTESIASVVTSSVAVPNIESFVDPNAGGGGGTPSEDKTKKTYAKADIDKFYSDVTKGRYASRPEERAKLDKEYQAAIIAGRIT